MIQRVSAGYHRGENEQPHGTCPAMTEFVLRYDESPVMDAVTPAFFSLLVTRTISVLLRVSTCTYVHVHDAVHQISRLAQLTNAENMHRIED